MLSFASSAQPTLLSKKEQSINYKNKNRGCYFNKKTNNRQNPSAKQHPQAQKYCATRLSSPSWHIKILKLINKSVSIEIKFIIFILKIKIITKCKQKSNHKQTSRKNQYSPINFYFLQPRKKTSKSNSSNNQSTKKIIIRIRQAKENT